MSVILAMPSRLSVQFIDYRNPKIDVHAGNFLQGSKVPFFVMKSALFVQAVNTKLTSKVPLLFGNFDVLKANLVENVQFRYGMTGNISEKDFLGALFNIQKCLWKPVPPPPPQLH